jgi:hypothetical protein
MRAKWLGLIILHRLHRVPVDVKVWQANIFPISISLALAGPKKNVFPKKNFN